MSDTCSLFPLFRDPWPSCLLPSHYLWVKLSEGYMVSLCIISYNCIWIYNDLKIKKSLTLAAYFIRLETPGLPAYSSLIIQPFHPLLSPSPTFNLSHNESLVKWFFKSGGQRIGVSASASVLPMNIQDWSLGWTGWISLQSKTLKSLLQHHSSKA